MSYAVATAALTALGRLSFPAAQALESRYGSTAFVFWIALAGLLFRRLRHRAGESIVGVLACAFAIGIARAQGLEEAVALRRLEPLRPAETALLAGALEKRTIDRITPAPVLVVDALPELRKRRLSIFNRGWVSWIGAPIDRFIRKRDDHACEGFLDRAFAVPAYGAPAFRVEGWAYSLERDSPLNRIVFVDENGIVLGFGLTGVERRDVHLSPLGVRDEFTGFEGHIGSLQSEDVQLTAVALLKGRVGCWLNPSRTVHEADALPLVVK
jgi:hypothetical protein